MSTLSQPKTSAGGRPRGTTAPQSDAVKRVREKMGISQEQLSRELGCSTSSIAKMEQQGRLPGSGALRTAFEKLAKRTGVSLEIAA